MQPGSDSDDEHCYEEQDQGSGAVDKQKEERKQRSLEKEGIQKLGAKSLEELIDKFQDREWEEFLSNYQITKVIGSGGFGVVLAAIDNRDLNKKKVALKVSLKGNIKEDVLIREWEILNGMDHPNIIKIYKMINFQNFVILSMKLLHESVEDFHLRRIQENKPLMDEECAALSRGIL